MMRSVWHGLRVILSLGDALVMMCSPMFIILIVLCVFMLLYGGGVHWRLVNGLEKDGLVAYAVIVDEKPSETLGWMVEFDDPAQANKRHGWIDPVYYSSDVAATLAEGAEVEIRYFPQPYQSEEVLNRHFDQVKGYWGYATDGSILFLVSWLMLIWHPEFLYLGYELPFQQILTTALDQVNQMRPGK